MLNSIVSLFSTNSRIQASRLKLYKAAYSWTHDPALAEDLTQDTLIKAITCKSELQEPKYLDTWLFRILRNTWHDYLKSQKNMVDIDDFVFTAIDDVQQDYSQNELVSRVRSEMAKLPLALREVITLSDHSGFNYKQLAEILDIPLGTVMSRLYKARKVLQQNLTDISFNEIEHQQDRSTPPTLRQVI